MLQCGQEVVTVHCPTGSVPKTWRHAGADIQQIVMVATLPARLITISNHDIFKPAFDHLKHKISSFYSG